MCPSNCRETTWSVLPAPPPKPSKYTDAGSPGITMLVLRAVKPRLTTSRPRSEMSSMVLRGGVPSVSGLRALVVPQWDQYSRTVSRVGPPNSSTTDMPRALALMSTSAHSMPAMAFAAIPPGLWRVARTMSQNRIS